MNLILKTTFKNIFCKPVRTLLVVFAIFMCALAAMFCFDLGGSLKTLITDIYAAHTGTADISISGSEADPEKFPEDFPVYDMLKVNTFTDQIYESCPGEYYVATAEAVSIYGIDLDKAAELGLIDRFELGTCEAVITDRLAELYGCEEGDVVSVHDNANETHDIVITKIVPLDVMNHFFRGYSMVVNEDTSNILSCGKEASAYYLIDVLDDSAVNTALDVLKTTFPNCTVESYAMDESRQKVLDEIMAFMVLLFAVAFLLVVFVTASICNRIVSERMSFIGTLRSLGLSAGKTTLVLLLENILYALMGALPAVWLYTGLRGQIFGGLLSSMVTDDGMTVSIPTPDLSAALVAAVVIGALVIECVIPLRAQLKAVKTSIRDIIFDNRDTAYKFSRFAITLGIVMAVTAIVAFFFRSNLLGAAVCLLSSVTALALLYPLLHKFVTDHVAKAAHKCDNEKWALSAKEAGKRKSTVSSGVLSATASAMCILIFTICSGMINMFSYTTYDCDVRADCMAQPKYLSFVEHLDGVNETEYLYDKADWMIINGEREAAQFYGLPEGGYSMYNGFLEVPDSVESGTILISKFWGNRYGYSVGDEINVVFDPDGVFPIERTFTIAGYFEIETFESLKNDFVISLDDFIEIFHDTPATLLVRCDDPEATASALEMYSAGKLMLVKTIEQYNAENRQSAASTSLIFTIVLAVAFVMTFIGMVSNQLLGFEGRKKECAVMVSTSMSKSTMMGILFREMLLTSAMSSTIGAIVGTALVAIIGGAIRASDSIQLPMDIEALPVILMWLGMIIIFALTVLMPVRNLKKMKLAEQLKYE